MLDDDLLVAAREKRDQLSRRVKLWRQVVEEAEDELRVADQAVHAITQLKKEQDDFNDEAGRYL